jgi:hypothetical protein
LIAQCEWGREVEPETIAAVFEGWQAPVEDASSSELQGQEEEA